MDDRDLTVTAIPPDMTAEISAAVRLGFETMSDLTDRICERLGVDGADSDVIDTIGSLIFAVLAEQESWSRPTDAERLVSAFDQLAGIGIIAHHYLGPTRGDAEAKLLFEARGPLSGYVFYTPADARALLDGVLELSWGVSQDADEGAADVLAGRLISTLAEAGLTVQWSGEQGAPMRLSGIDWKHPRDPESMDTALATRLAPSPPQVTTEDGKWLFRIAVVAHDHGAHAMLLHIHQRTTAEARGAAKLGDFASHADYAFAFTPAGLEIDGRQVQFDLVAPPSHSWEAQTETIQIADALVLVPGGHFGLAEMQTRIHIMRGGRPPHTTIVLDRWETADVTRANESAIDPAIEVDLESGDGVLEALRTVVVPLVAGLQKKLSN